MAHAAFAAPSKGSCKWWDGYQGKDTVILDDFDCKELGHLLWAGQQAARDSNTAVTHSEGRTWASGAPPRPAPF